LAYQPAWQGGFVWDDNVHVTPSRLQSADGLRRIWFEVGATAQYYPLLHSAFWIEHKLWGDATLGYHLTNLLQHALAAILVALILRRLAVPGAYLAAALFALHPVHVESVAWIAEQKNTLSGVFYLGAMLTYLHFDRTRKWSSYAGALTLFILGVMCKTVIATLPGALLVIFWWQRGRLLWKNDVLPLAPLIVLGAGGGLVTAWWELQINKCFGPDFALTFIERCLIAGRTVWFSLWKLIWPTNLTFMYPRWQIDATAWWQYVFPLGAVALLGALWAMRGKARAPLAALLFFGGTLFPVLGFFNLYTFKYSFVANHYQYLASLGIIAMAAGSAALLLDHWGLWRRPAGYAACLIALAGLGTMTWRQSQTFADAETLYRTTIAENPACWLAHNNLGLILADRRRTAEAIEHYRQALEIKPDCAEVCNNLGTALINQGNVDEAAVQFGKAVEINPDYAEAHNNLGNALANRGRIDEAIAHYEKALEITPDYAKAHSNLGNVLARRGRFDEAIPHLRKALEIDPAAAVFHNNYGLVLATCNRLDEAVAQLRTATEIKPDYADAHCNLGHVLVKAGRLDEAAAEFQKALEIEPNHARARYHFGNTLYRQGRIADAVGQWNQLILLQPNDIAALNQMAWVLATSPTASIRNAAAAVELAKRAVQLSAGKEPAVLGTLAAAYAEAGRFAEAVETAQQSLDLATGQNNTALADVLRAQIKLYQAGSPCRDLRQPSAPQSN
jgi:tetratricopeptide (TPR) repeat protein